MKILITGGNSSVALKIHKAFKGAEILLADYGDMPNISSQNYQLVSLGAKTLDTLAHTLLSFCLDHNVDTLLPLYTFEFEAVAKAKTLFLEFGIDMLLPELDDLTNYLSPINPANFIVLNKGKLLFKSFDDEVILASNEKLLSGAFYVERVNHQNTYSLISLV